MEGVIVVDHPLVQHKLTLVRDKDRSTKSFRELVLFTPVHRNAVAIEPYTCAADASTWCRPSGMRALSQ